MFEFVLLLIAIATGFAAGFFLGSMHGMNRMAEALTPPPPQASSPPSPAARNAGK